MFVYTIHMFEQQLQTFVGVDVLAFDYNIQNVPTFTLLHP